MGKSLRKKLRDVGESYFLRNLLKRWPGLAGVGVGRREGSGRGDFKALAGTAMGARVVELLGPARDGRVVAIPEGRGAGRGMAAGPDPG